MFTERITEFGSMKRDDLKAAVEVNVRAYENYVYFTNYFPDREERIKAIRDIIGFMKTLLNNSHFCETLMQPE